jgi:hypothetical protein
VEVSSERFRIDSRMRVEPFDGSRRASEVGGVEAMPSRHSFTGLPGHGALSGRR